MNNKAHLRPKDFDSNGNIFPSGWKDERPQGEYEFIEILAQSVPDEVCVYPEYKGKPYYSIHCKRNGEDFVGFSTYSLEVLSRDLKEYFMKGDAK